MVPPRVAAPARNAMRRLSLLGRILILTLLGTLAVPAAPVCAVNGVPTADHVVVVIMENKFYQDVWTAPYTASLIDAGTLFMSSYAITNPSQPNYIAIWSGSTQGVVDDQCPAPGSPFTTANLGAACEAAGISWKAYSEDLPFPSYPGCVGGDSLYVRKHAPWTNFSNLNHQRERRFQDLATDIAGGTLPRLAFVIPNQCNNTHDCPVATGDAWLAANVPALLEAAGPSGFVIVTWDEDDDFHGNHILTIFAGGLVKSGYVTYRWIDHYSVLRTICEALGLAPFGTAAARSPITDVWVPTAGVDDAAAPAATAVRPNPSRGPFELRLAADPSRPVDGVIYDAGGRRVTGLIPRAAGGETILRWDGRWADGRPATPGAYFLKIDTGGQRQVEKLILVP
jgi:phosphatidylinositol-3-phosphatase